MSDIHGPASNGAPAESVGNAIQPGLSQLLTFELDPGRRLALINEHLCPPEPQLLDTCVLQNLDWVDRQVDAAGSVVWDDAATAKLVQKYGTDLTEDLIDLGTLYKRFEYEFQYYPWLVCDAAVEEAGFLRGPNGERLRQLIEFLSGHQEDWSADAYPGIARGLLLAQKGARVSPLMLRGLGVTSIEELHKPDGPLSFLPDRGDRLIATHALLANIPAVLTTDRKTFWAFRERLADFGLIVLRPVELLNLYIPYWDALREESDRRQAVRKSDTPNAR